MTDSKYFLPAVSGAATAAIVYFFWDKMPIETGLSPTSAAMVLGASVAGYMLYSNSRFPYNLARSAPGSGLLFPEQFYGI